MRIHNFLPTAVALLFTGAVARAQSEPVPESDERVVAIYDQLAASLARLESIEYTAERTIRNHVLNVPATTDQLQFGFQGDQWYSRFTDFVLGRPTEVERTFSGTEYRQLQGRILRIYSAPPSGFVGGSHFQPIVIPLMFVFEYGDDLHGDHFRFDTLLDDGTWEHLVAESVWLRTETVNEHVCDVVQVTKVQTRFEAEFKYSVFLDRTLDCYPVMWECDIRPLPDAKRVTETARMEGSAEAVACDTPTGRVVVPTVVTHVVYMDDQLSRSIELRIDPETLRVNEEVAESMFTIPRDRAAQIIIESDDEAGDSETPGSDPDEAPDSSD